MSPLFAPFRFIFEEIFFPPTGVRRVIAWTTSLTLVLLFSSWLSWNLGYMRYYYNGQPNDYPTLVRTQSNYRLLGQMGNNRMGGSLLDAPVLLGDPFSLMKQNPFIHLWTPLTPEAAQGTLVHPASVSYQLVETDILLTFHTESDGRIRFYELVAQGFNQQIANSFLVRMRSRWGIPKVIEQPFEDDPNIGNRMMWWNASALLIVEWRREQLVPHREPELTLHLSVYPPESEMYRDTVTQEPANE
ncbi:MAG: hypothetical protein SFY68_15810 [Candidatus Sumerlaeia bacterium]|nr:hypothetical protein [Candidatus Sumerlaeia bacterium]